MFNSCEVTLMVDACVALVVIFVGFLYTYFQFLNLKRMKIYLPLPRSGHSGDGHGQLELDQYIFICRIRTRLISLLIEHDSH